MRNPTPPIREDVAAPKPYLQHVDAEQQRPRVQPHDLLASWQVQTCQDVVRLLDIHGRTRDRWLAISAAS